MGDHGVGPCASFLSGKRSTAELVTLKICSQRAKTRFSQQIIRINPFTKSELRFVLYQNEARAGIEPAHSCFIPHFALRVFEARSGIEPLHSCFADSRVTTSPPSHPSLANAGSRTSTFRFIGTRWYWETQPRYHFALPLRLSASSSGRANAP